MIRRLLGLPYKILRKICLLLPYFRFVEHTTKTQTPISFDHWFQQEVMGVNQGPYWPVHPSSTVTGWRNIDIGIETSPGYMGGCYIQGLGKIVIGDYTQIAANVGIVSENHALTDNREHLPGVVRIGRYCWIGFGAIILPNVVLGDYTVVGAGSVVTRSFPDGYCVIAGNPARLVREIPAADCVFHRSEHEYHGYIPAAEFAAFRERELRVDE